ncbi:MAG: DsbA family protein [Betaproteobacteria bacterium]|nr:DsbA family protein [Betaproteobacteria bacterium]
MSASPTPHLVYFADPMCSWCWGFSPVIQAVEQEFGDRLPIRVVLGGLRPGTRTPMLDADRASVREHWQHVHAMTGQAFDWGFFDRADFVYDTEPACRAVVVLRRQGEALALRALRHIQQAFYAGNQDVTDGAVLASIAAGLGVDAGEFEQEWRSAQARELTGADFALAQASGIRGFPTLIAGAGGDQAYALVTHGYQARDAVLPALRQWLAAQPGA